MVSDCVFAAERVCGRGVEEDDEGVWGRGGVDVK